MHNVYIYVGVEYKHIAHIDERLGRYGIHFFFVLHLHA